MIKERYVNSEVAKLLRDKGFNEHCYTYYDDIDDAINRFDKGYHFNNTSYPWGVPYDISKAKKYVVAPTQQMACDWIKENHKIHIVVRFVSKLGYVASVCDISNPDSTLYMLNTRAFPNTESVYNEALKCILTTMI